MEQCPLCFSTLEVRDCAPCHDCGGSPQELEHFAQGIHTYKVYEVGGKGRLTLCNICEVDIGSYTPVYWGSSSKHIVYSDLAFVRELPSPRLVKDKVCPTCQHRLPFLSFVAAVRASEEPSET